MTDAKVSVVLKINFGMVIKQLASFFFSCERKDGASAPMGSVPFFPHKAGA